MFVNRNVCTLFNFVLQGAMKIMIGLRVSPKFKEFLQSQADQENRTLSNFITNAVLTYVRDHKKVEWREELSKKPKNR